MKRVIAITALGIVLGAPVWADAADGVWQTEPGNDGGYLFVTVKACGAKICGTITGAVDKKGKKDPKYKNLGKPIIWDMSADGGNAYSGGTVWAPDSDKKYSSKMTLSGNVLTVKGCVFGGLICRGQDWTRVK